MKAQAFVDRCDKARSTGNGTWIACCPAHGDKSPSMTVRELEDGRVLIHCFAGCEVHDILRAVALDWDAIFPDKLSNDHCGPLRRRSFPAADVLEAVSNELLVAFLIAGDIHKKRDVSQEGYARLQVAMQRINEARQIANGDRPLGRR